VERQQQGKYRRLSLSRIRYRVLSGYNGSSLENGKYRSISLKERKAPEK
jgi:hypothetical protein